MIGCAFKFCLPLLIALAMPVRGALAESDLLPAPINRTNHAPGLVERADGSLLACWYSGRDEGADDSVILCSDSAGQGQTWHPAWQAVAAGDRAAGAREANKAVGNVVLWRDGPHRIWMVHGVIQRFEQPLLGNICLNWSCGRVDIRVSDDDGQHWGGAIRLDDRVGALPRNPPLALAGAGLLLPVYLENDQHSGVLLLDPSLPTRVLRQLPIPGEHVIQPALVAAPDGTVRAYLRDTETWRVRVSRLDLATGQFLPVVPTDLPNPNSAVVALAIPSGEIAVIGNPSTRNRQALVIGFSRDGLHFTRRCTLVAAGEEGDVAYPAALLDRNRRLQIIYSGRDKHDIGHQSRDADWLRTCQDASEN